MKRLWHLATWISLLLPALAVTGAPRADTQPQTYYLLVFSAPLAGREDEYNSWYQSEHAPAVVSVPGFVAAQRYELSELQLRPGPSPKPKYLVIYKIRTTDLAAVYAEVNNRSKSGRTRMSSSLDLKSLQNYTYRAFRPEITHSGAGGAQSSTRESKRYVQLVFADPADGREDEFNRWYDAHHAPDVVAVPGFTSGQRLVWSDVQMTPDAKGQKYLTIFQIDTLDLAATFAQFAKRAPHMSMSKAFDGARTFGYTFQAIGPVIDGEKVRALRQ